MLDEYPIKNNESMDVSITHLSLSKRARNALLRAGISTLKEATQWSDRGLLSLPHIGRTSVATLRAHIGRMSEDPQT